jgi:Circularly permutated YpsA SLOG family
VASPARIVSGGQSGVDRAALDVAIALGIAHGGWCPLGGWAEDLPEPPGLLARYPLLQPTPGTDPSQRTRWNVRDSGATLVVIDGRAPAPGSGTALTVTLARGLGRPLALVELDHREGALRAARALLAGLGDGSLNVAGPRESGAPGIYERARRFLTDVLGG